MAIDLADATKTQRLDGIAVSIIQIASLLIALAGAFDDFAASLDKNTSALELVGENDTLADFDGVITPLGGKIVKTDLNENDVKQIRKALKQDG